MTTLYSALYYVLPIISIILFIMGIAGYVRALIGALWLSLLGILFQYHLSGSEILGSYFDYKNASLYTLYLLIFIISLLYFIITISASQKKIQSYLSWLSFVFPFSWWWLLLTNIWINACFIENRYENTPIMQITTFKKSEYCNYQYAFYKINNNKEIEYLCPNYYGIIPKIGKLDTSPDFILNYLAQKINMKLNKMATKSNKNN